MVVGLAGAGLRAQLTSANVSNTEQKNFGGQLFFQENAQLITGNMNTIVPYLAGTASSKRYDGHMKVTGYAQVFSSEINAQDKTAFQQVLWNFYDVDPQCNPPDLSINAHNHQLNVPNSCAVWIDKVQSCSEESLGPLYNHGVLQNNPWQATAYNAFQQYWNGITGFNNEATQPINTAQGGTTIVTGLGMQQVQNHALIIHNYAGKPIACGMLTTAGGTIPWTPDLTLAPTPTPR